MYVFRALNLPSQGVGSELNDKSTEELLSFLNQGFYQNDEFVNDHFQSSGGPDPSSVMFDDNQHY